MKKLLINKESIVLVSGKGNHSREVTLPFYLADIAPCADDSSYANSPYCVIDLAGSPTKSLRMTFEPGIIIRHINAVYQATNIYRYNANSNPMLSMRHLSAEPLTDSDIITACVQLSDVEDIPLESAIVTGIDKRICNTSSRKMNVKRLALPEGYAFDTVFVLSKPRRYFSTSHFDIFNCDITISDKRYSGCLSGFTVCTGKMQYPIILASTKKGGEF